MRIARRADPTTLTIETPELSAGLATHGYVSGIAGGTFLDKKTGARDLGFGLAIADFLLEPADPDAPIPPGQYDFGNLVHGAIPKRYVEGPQICTQAGRLSHEVIAGDGFTAIRHRYTWNVAYPPRESAGSIWEQTLIFRPGRRDVLCADRIEVANASDALTFRRDLPGHVRLDDPGTFEHVYLSYNDPPILPSTDFRADFPPDDRYRYLRDDDAPPPERFIRAYQVNLDGEPGPWLAGMTLHPPDVSEAWCHRRGYICMIQELGGRPVRPGDVFGACDLIGWYDDLDAIRRAYDEHKGWSGLELLGPSEAPTGFRGLAAEELAVP